MKFFRISYLGTFHTDLVAEDMVETYMSHPMTREATPLTKCETCGKDELDLHLAGSYARCKNCADSWNENHRRMWSHLEEPLDLITTTTIN